MGSISSIIDVVAYTWDDAHDTMIRLPPRTSSDFPPRTSDYSTGLFEMLPLGVRYLVLEEFDLASLEIFRALNSGCNALVESLPDYRDIRKHARGVLRVLAATKLSSRFTARQLYAALSTERCVSCPKFGAYIFLPTFTRCCRPCLEINPDLQVIRTAQARACYGLTRKQLETLPILWSIPGMISATGDVFGESISLVSTRQARDLGIATHGSLEEMQRFAAAKWQRMQRKHSGRRLPREGTRDPYPYIPRVPTSFHRYDHLLGFATTGCPYFNRRTQHVQVGLYCRGCRKNTAFSDEEFMEHFHTCPPAQQFWSMYLEGIHLSRFRVIKDSSKWSLQLWKKLNLDSSV